MSSPNAACCGPPTPERKNWPPASSAEIEPAVIAPAATRNAARPVPSLTSASPSTIVVRRSGAPSRRNTVVAATGSVGPRIAPSANASAHVSEPTISCATSATMTSVVSTSPTESSPIERTWARSMRGLDTNAA